LISRQQLGKCIGRGLLAVGAVLDAKIIYNRAGSLRVDANSVGSDAEEAGQRIDEQRVGKGGNVGLNTDDNASRGVEDGRAGASGGRKSGSAGNRSSGGSSRNDNDTGGGGLRGVLASVIDGSLPSNARVLLEGFAIALVLVDQSSASKARARDRSGAVVLANAATSSIVDFASTVQALMVLIASAIVAAVASKARVARD